MKYYKVSARKNGKKINVIIKASTAEAAFNIVRIKHKVKPVSAIETDPPFLLKLLGSFGKKKKVSYDDLIAAFKQMSFMLNSGISIQSTLEDLVNYTNNEVLAGIFNSVLNGVNSGKTLRECFMDHKDIIGGLPISMVALGEKTGNLAESLSMLVKSLEELRDNKAKFKKALRYPMFVAIAMTIAFVILCMVVIPQFKGIFAELGADLPLPTKILIGMEELMSDYGVFIAVGFVAFIIFVKNRYKKSIFF